MVIVFRYQCRLFFLSHNSFPSFVQFKYSPFLLLCLLPSCVPSVKCIQSFAKFTLLLSRNVVIVVLDGCTVIVPGCCVVVVVVVVVIIVAAVLVVFLILLFLL